MDAKDLAPQLRKQGFGNAEDLAFIAPTATIIFGTNPASTVRLAFTTPHWSGLRCWYLCPHCGRRARKLYRVDGPSPRLAGPA